MSKGDQLPIHVPAGPSVTGGTPTRHSSYGQDSRGTQPADAVSAVSTRTSPPSGRSSSKRLKPLRSSATKPMSFWAEDRHFLESLLDQDGHRSQDCSAGSRRQRTPRGRYFRSAASPVRLLARYAALTRTRNGGAISTVRHQQAWVRASEPTWLRRTAGGPRARRTLPMERTRPWRTRRRPYRSLTGPP
jgi:hypothetical protein